MTSSPDPDRLRAPTQTPEDLPLSRRLTRWLDDYYLDALIGFLLPGAGDVVTGVASVGLVVAAIRERVPTVILLRMLLNIAVDVIVGAIPLLGDVFDIAWRSNRRNLALIEKHRGGKERPGVGDYLIVGAAILLTLLAVALPFLWMVEGYRALRGVLGG